MTREIKLVLLMATMTIIALVLHHSRRKQKKLSLTAYGRELLGIRETKAGRKLYLDFLRFFAVFLVIVTHSMGVLKAIIEVEKNLLYGGAAGGLEMFLLRGLGYVILCISALSLVCNLLFIMISGALLLPFKEERPGTFYAKRFSRVVIPLAAYYIVYLLWHQSISLHLPLLWNGIKSIISGPGDIVPHFWQAYLLVGLYIAVPFQRWMLKELPDSILRGMAAVVLAGSALRMVYYLIGCPFSYRSILFSWEGTFFLGYFLTLPCSKKYEKQLLAGGGIAAVVISCLFCVRRDAMEMAANDSFWMILFASAIVLWCKNREEEMKNKASRIFSVFVQVGNKYSFSILLIHWFVLFGVLEKGFNFTSVMLDLYGMFGLCGILFGVLVQILATLLISFLFALFFDQTVIFLAQWVWDKLVFLAFCGRGRETEGRKE